MIDPAFRQIIARFRSSRNWDDELDLRLLRALWPSIAGPQLSEHVSVLAIRGTEVILGVPDRTWQHQLLSLRPLLLRKINEPWSERRIQHLRIYENHRL